MNYNLDKNTDGLIKSVISIDGDEWKALVDKAYEKNKINYTIQGFRKGKAPRAMIESQYGPTIFTQAALDEAFNEGYHKIMEENQDINPIAEPHVDLKKFDDTGIEITVEIPIMPTFTIAPYKNLGIKMGKAVVTDDEIETEIKHNLLRGSKLLEINDAIANEDLVNLDFEGFVEGKAFEGGKAENYQLKIGSHTFIDTFEEQLIGLKVGDKQEVVVTFPEEYHEKSLAGKPAVFKVEIKTARRREMPTFDEEFVKNTSEFESIQAYKENIKSIILKGHTEKLERETENSIIDAIVDKTEIKTPDSLVEHEQEHMVEGLTRQLSSQGLKLDDYLAYVGKSHEDFTNEQKKYAEKNVKTRFILEKIISEEKIEVEEADLDARLKEIADLQKMDIEELKKSLTQQDVSRYLNSILMSKVMNFLKENNIVKE